MSTQQKINQAIRDYRPTGLPAATWRRVGSDLRRRARDAQPSGVEDARKLCQAGARLVRELDGRVNWATLDDLLRPVPSCGVPEVRRPRGSE